MDRSEGRRGRMDCIMEKGSECCASMMFSLVFVSFNKPVLESSSETDRPCFVPPHPSQRSTLNRL